MKLHHRLMNGLASATYYGMMTGERIGFTIYKDPEQAFSPVHAILVHREDGPVIVVGENVLEVEVEDDIYPTREDALDAYYSDGHLKS